MQNIYYKKQTPIYTISTYATFFENTMIAYWSEDYCIIKLECHSLRPRTLQLFHKTLALLIHPKNQLILVF